MTYPGTGLAVAVGGVSVAAAPIAIGIAQIELSGQLHPDIWSNAWLLAALSLAGVGLFFAIVTFLAAFGGERRRSAASSPRSGEEAPVAVSSSEDGAAIDGTAIDDDVAEDSILVPDDQAIATTNLQRMRTNRLGRPLAGVSDQAELVQEAQPAYTALWRYTSDGFEASPLMNMTSLSISGFEGARGQSPQIRVGVCVACQPIGRDASSSHLGRSLLDFLGRAPVSTLMESVIGADDSLMWIRHAGNGSLSLEAVLAPSADTKPLASALLQPPVAGLSLYGRAEDIACLWIHVDPSRADSPARLSTWNFRFGLAVTIASAFAEFLEHDLDLRTTDKRPARAGFMIETVGPMSDLVDTEGISPLPGAIPSTQFLGYAIADGAGKPAERIGRDFLQTLCDHTMHLGDFEDLIDAINPARPESDTCSAV